LTERLHIHLNSLHYGDSLGDSLQTAPLAGRASNCSDKNVVI